MTQFQVRPKDKEESDRVQQALLELGYSWATAYPYPEKFHEVLFCQSDGRIGGTTIEQGNLMIDKFRMGSIPKILAEADKRKPLNPVPPPLAHEHPAIESINEEPTPEEAEAMMRKAMGRPEVQAALQALSGAFGDINMMPSDMPQPAPVDISSMMKKPGNGSIDDSAKEHISPNDFETVWIVWNPSGFHAPKKEYKNRVDAETEAVRLIKKQPGDVFYVMRAEKKYTASVSVTVTTL